MALQAVKGVGYLLQGLPLLLRPGVRGYVAAPWLINLLLFAGLLIAGVSQVSGLLEAIMAALPAWLQWLDWLLWPLFVLSLASAGFLICLLLATVIAAPFTGPLAAAIEAQLTGTAPQEGGGSLALLREAGGAIASEIRKFVYFAVRAAPLLLLFVIPGINAIAAPLWLLFGVWMLALEYAEIPMGNRGLAFPDVRVRVSERKLLALGYGTAVFVLTLIPVINFFVIPAAVAGATVMVVREKMTGADDG